MTKQRRLLKFVSVFAVLMFIAAACGGDGDDGGEGTGAAPAEFELRKDVEGNTVEIPQADDMVDSSQFQTDPPWTIGYSDASLSNSARVFIWQYTQWAAEEYPQIEEVIRTNANDSPDKQISDIEDLLARDVDCLIVAATSEDAVNPAIELATSQGVPVVIQERDVTTDQYTSFVSIRTRDIGTLQAEETAKILGGEGNVVLLEGLAGSGPAEEARRGHQQVFADHPGIEILATEYTGWSRDEGKTIMENWLQAFPQIDAVVADSGIQQQGAYEAVEAAGRLDEIKVWTGDSLQAWIRQVNEQKIPGAIVNRPLKFGAITVDACAALLAGVDIPRIWYDPVELLPMDNLGDFVAPNVPGSDEWWDWWDLPKEWWPE
jgi:ribose transport system substrate-binding protein